jgi:protein-L-isoaspartate(D-aspartate) O-methyltransferase
MIELHEMEQLVEAIEQELGRSLCPLVRQAFLQVPRHLFIEQYYQQRGSSLTWDLVQATMKSVYQDQPLVIQLDQRGRPTSSSSQPSIMAIQLEALDLESGHSVLEIGAGTGYNAALMGVLVGQGGEVTSIDINADLVLEASKMLARAGATNVRVLQEDGFVGYLAYAPYDRILATCSVESIPRAWVDQLKLRGLLVCNMVTSLASLFVRVEKNELGNLEGGFLDLAATYMPMHTGALPPKTKVDWAYYLSDRLSEAHSLQLASAELGRSPLASWLSRRTQSVAGRNKIEYYDSLPHTSIRLSECFETLLKNPAYSLLLHSFLTGVTKRYRSSNDQIQLYLLINDTAIQVKDDVLTIYGNNAWAEQQIKQSIDLYRHLGQPPITEYHISIQGQQVLACIADHLVYLVP